MTADFNHTPLTREVLCGPEAYLPGRDLHLLHASEVLRPAVAFAAEIGGVTPAHALGKAVAYLQLSTCSGLVELNKVTGLHPADRKQTIDEWLEAASQDITRPPLGADTMRIDENMKVWGVLGASILAATEPGISHPDAHNELLISALRSTVPLGVGVNPEGMSAKQRHAVLKDYGQAEVQLSALRLGNELVLNAGAFALISFIGEYLQYARKIPLGEKRLDSKAMIIELDDICRATEGNSSKAIGKRLGNLAARIMDGAKLLGYLPRTDTRELPPQLAQSIEGAEYFETIASEVIACQATRSSVSIEARNDLRGAYAQNTLQAYTELQQPYAFASNKELRNSPYWAFCSLLTGHSKEKLPGFEPLDRQQATDIAATLSRVVALLRQSPDDPDATLYQVMRDRAEEASLEASYKTAQAEASVGVIAPARFNSVRQRLDVLCSLWPKVRTGAEKTVCTAQEIEELDMVFAMIKEGEL